MSGQIIRDRSQSTRGLSRCPLSCFALLAAGYGLQRFFPIGGGDPAIESVIAGNALMVIAFVIAVLGAWEMFKAQPRYIRPAGVRPGKFRNLSPHAQSDVSELPFFIIGFGLAFANSG